MLDIVYANNNEKYPSSSKITIDTYSDDGCWYSSYDYKWFSNESLFVSYDDNTPEPRSFISIINSIDSRSLYSKCHELLDEPPSVYKRHRINYIQYANKIPENEALTLGMHFILWCNSSFVNYINIIV